MRDRARLIMVHILLLALVAVVPIGIARHMLKQSRPDAFVQDKPNYLAHQYPPQGEAELTKKLAKLLHADMHHMQAVPRVFLSRLPQILPAMDNAAERKKLFISAMLPIILRANELIIADRGRLIAIHEKLETNTPLSKAEQQWLKATARQYRVKLGSKIDLEHVNRLLFKVDVVPTSLALAQAAMETGWGTSKFAQKGNALFGEWVWGQDAEGIVPSGREEGKTHKIKSFDYLLDSVRSYMTNLNRHRSYRELRVRRAELRDHEVGITGAALAPALIDYSERGSDYVSDILSIISFNEFDALDHATLESS